ncbi:MAG: hypothetical protein AAGH74_01825 [Pseudomonadota bacterium]
MSPEELHAAILAAHEAEDGVRLAELYAMAADQAERAQDVDATCFFLTQAYVFALDAGHETASDLHRRLLAFGREE